MKPTLVIQMQRMGDLVLTFPLLARLRELSPSRPLWVLAEPRFYKQLMPLTPSGVTYMSPRMIRPILETPLHRIINLSHREAATDLTGKAQADSRTGFYRDPDGALRTSGVWSLYRASLTHNNRHNRLHWADLNTLDVLPPEALTLPIWPRPRPLAGTGRVGLFVGASQREKRPNAAFWGSLARRLAARGLKPVFLGGPADRPIAQRAAKLGGFLETANLAGQFSIAELVTFFTTLDMVVTPDTGPMHVSAWAGIPTLNLSMGPVNPWETAPASPGHHVLRPTISCTGCWQCPHQIPPCHRAFVPRRVAGLVLALLHGGPLEKLDLPGLDLCRTARAGNLFVLSPLHAHTARPRNVLGRFWKQWFLSVLGGAPHSFADARDALLPHTALCTVLTAEAARLSTALGLECRKGRGRGESLRDTDFWMRGAPAFRPLAGFVQMLLQNGGYSPAALLDALELTARFVRDIADSGPDSGLLPLPSTR